MSTKDPNNTAVAALMADAIIEAMATEISDDTDLKAFRFISAAYQEYRRRGGHVPTHLGGPAEAIRRLKRRP
ncbi:MAG TPA: hypothetical protein VHL53_09595 [Acidimicrobiia bacterium]|nr:hypothetical protein [Acidimicrobiia bacterium]